MLSIEEFVGALESYLDDIIDNEQQTIAGTAAEIKRVVRALKTLPDVKATAPATTQVSVLLTIEDGGQKSPVANVPGVTVLIRDRDDAGEDELIRIDEAFALARKSHPYKAALRQVEGETEGAREPTIDMSDAPTVRIDMLANLVAVRSPHDVEKVVRRVLNAVTNVVSTALEDIVVRRVAAAFDIKCEE